MPLPKSDPDTAYRVLMDNAMEARTQANADSIFAELVTLVRALRPDGPMGIITQTLREALGYHAGYFGEETRERVERLYRCAHPFFGPIAHVPPPVGMEAWELGRENARRMQAGEPFITLAEYRALKVQ